MKRRAVQFLFAVSLLLALALALLWVRSIWTDDWFSLERTWVIENDTVVSEYAGFGIDHGLICVTWRRAEVIPQRRVARISRETAPWRFNHRAFPRAPMLNDPTRPWWRRLGFYWDVGGGPVTVAVPAWFGVAPPLAVACLTFRRLVRDRRRRDRVARGMCLACGYDLRGAAHDRCPECREPVAVAAVRV